MASCNAAAAGYVNRWPDWPRTGLAIWGPAGCGKSHLATIWLQAAGARAITIADLADPFAPAILAVHSPLLLDMGAGSVPARGEQALLHLVNGVREAGTSLLIAARTPPARWPTALADLRSRLRAMDTVRITGPDDAFLARLLVKLCADRQLRVPGETLTYALRRMDRSFESAWQLVGMLDRLALRLRRPVTIPLVRAALDGMRMTEVRGTEVREAGIREAGP